MAGMVFEQRGSTEWDRMWDVIRDAYGSTTCENNGEAWQYMGTTVGDNGEKLVHQFRHRDLSGKGRVHIDIKAA